MSFGGGGSVKETEQARALAEISAKRWNRYQQVYVPLENQFIRDAMSLRNKENYEKASAIAAAATAKPFANARKQADMSMFAGGINPNSGRARSAALAEAEARGLGANVASANIKTTDRYLGGIESVIAMGQGQAGNAIQGMSDIARSAESAAADQARAAYQRSQGYQEALGVGAGIVGQTYMKNNTGD